MARRARGHVPLSYTYGTIARSSLSPMFGPARAFGAVRAGVRRAVPGGAGSSARPQASRPCRGVRCATWTAHGDYLSVLAST
eukprot:2003055-Prymnesium_polylepis.1